MRVFAISDIHVDFQENYHWVNNLSGFDYLKDILILAGDITHDIPLLKKTLKCLKLKFKEVFFIPGNHEFWISNSCVKNSLDKLRIIKNITADCGIRMEPFHDQSLSIIPLYGWYDYSFQQPSKEILETWNDYAVCKWPESFDEKGITQYFMELNQPFMAEKKNKYLISYSHFLPRIDIMPYYIPTSKRIFYPVLGTTLLEKQIRKLGSKIHVYGHTHVNNRVMKDGTLYINNAYGYPYETRITAKKLECIFEM